MSYTLANTATLVGKKEHKQQSLVALIAASTETVLVGNSLQALIKAKADRDSSEIQAKAAIRSIMEKIQANDEQSAEPDSPMFDLLSKIMKAAGRALFKHVVKPVLRFAARVAMNLVRIALRSLVVFVLEPALALVGGLIAANPITAAIAGVALLAGGGYWLWSKFFKSDIPEPNIPEVDTANVATQESDAESGPVAHTSLAPAPVQKYEKSFKDYITAPLDVVKNMAKPKKGDKFTGFGADVDAYIKEASSMYGLPEDVLRGFVKMEGGWTGKMSPTGAIGTGQFIQSTWDSLAATPDGQAIGMTKIGPRFRKPDDPRFNKRINTLATALLAKSNARLLTNAGLPVTGENLYMLHNIGPGIIPVMQGRPASAKTLKAMQQNGMLPGQSAAEFLIYQKGRFNAQYAVANTKPTTVVAETKPVMKEGLSLEKRAKVAALAPTANTAGNVNMALKPDREIVRGRGKTLVEVS